MATLRFTLNGRPRTLDTESERPLLEVLREDLDLTGTKYGCGEGQCGARTVLVDARPALACITPVRAVQGQTVTTVEGLAPPGANAAYDAAGERVYSMPIRLSSA